MNEQIKK